MAGYPLQKSKIQVFPAAYIARIISMRVAFSTDVAIKFSAILRSGIKVKASVVRLQTPKRFSFLFIKLIYDIFMPFFAFMTSDHFLSQFRTLR